jgi:hypothetical protein
MIRTVSNFLLFAIAMLGSSGWALAYQGNCPVDADDDVIGSITGFPVGTLLSVTAVGGGDGTHVSTCEPLKPCDGTVSLRITTVGGVAVSYTEWLARDSTAPPLVDKDVGYHHSGSVPAPPPGGGGSASSDPIELVPCGYNYRIDITFTHAASSSSYTAWAKITCGC